MLTLLRLIIIVEQGAAALSSSPRIVQRYWWAAFDFFDLRVNRIIYDTFTLMTH